ncbi:MAG TPA: UDP-N-acetylglucosamine 2-epimerase (non-hydrolyzing) [Limnochordales bacterium]
MLIFGTRPEAIKLAPVVHALRSRGRLDVTIVVTAQHREMLDQVLDVFQLKPDVDLDLMTEDQTLNGLAGRALQRLDHLLVDMRPDVVVVQGDTTTAMVGALAAFHRRIPAAHVEAGLRTDNPSNPFPEEMNRRLVGRIAQWHFAPTPGAREHLLREQVPPETVLVTGNTVIDALYMARRPGYRFSGGPLAEAAAWPGRLVLMTTHRRENLGEPLRRIYSAVRRLLQRFPDVAVAFPVHRNPHVRAAAAELAGQERVFLMEPPHYLDFVHLLERAHFVLTDSGGIQEEALALGKPVLVLRTTTERPEGVAAGGARLAGTDPVQIEQEAARLLTDPEAYRAMATAPNPYGDGRAAQRIAHALEHIFGWEPNWPDEFVFQVPMQTGANLRG